MILQAFYEAEKTKGKPTAILAKTFKGKNFVNVEDLENWHGKAIVGNQGQEIIKVVHWFFISKNFYSKLFNIFFIYFIEFTSNDQKCLS